MSFLASNPIAKLAIGFVTTLSILGAAKNLPLLRKQMEKSGSKTKAQRQTLNKKTTKTKRIQKGRKVSRFNLETKSLFLDQV